MMYSASAIVQCKLPRFLFGYTRSDSSCIGPSFDPHEAGGIIGCIMENTSLQAKATPKDFFLWAGAMVALYVSVYSLITLLFSYIDFAFPDPLTTYYGDPYSGTIRFAMASLIVLFPTYVILMQVIRKGSIADPSRLVVWVRRWALYLTLFVAGASIAIDLIVLLNTFLGGEITSRFVLKVAVAFLLAGAFFLHFFADLRGYWSTFPARSRMVAVGATILVFASVVSGFFIIGSPTSARLYIADDLKVQDLTSIQWQVVNFWQAKQKLPVALSEIADPISGFVVPTDKQTGASYKYEVVGAISFKLCATFNKESRVTPGAVAVPVKPVGSEDNWQHASGEQCFTRTIDPQRYPPNTPTKI